jgi:hypothetical protein
MPRLANDRNEQYARHRARGMNAAKSALAAGYAPGASTTHMENDPEIQARIGELMDEFKAQRDQQRAAASEAAKIVGQMTGVGRAWVIEKLAENAQNAAREGAFKESNEALKLIGEEFGMFQGQQNDDSEGSAVPKTLNMDSLESVLDAAHDALPPPAPTGLPLYGEETAMKLIEGQTGKGQSNRVPVGDRKLTTGSETDVALMRGEPDTWIEIDPKTDPDQLVRMALGEIPIVPREPSLDDDPD